MIRVSTVVGVNEQSQVSEARRMVRQFAEQQKFGETKAAQAGLIATELSTNLIKHGGGGSLLVGSDDEDDVRSVVIVGIDKGPGMASVDTAMRDGYSTAGSNGTGLGAVRRASSFFDVFSTSGNGTIVLCGIEDRDAGQRGPISLPAAGARLSVAGISLPKCGETEIGDSWTADANRDSTTVAVIDGLGHGPQASLASSSGVRAFRERSGPALETLFQEMHAALRPTRGAAVGVARVDPERSVVEFAGVGNIAASIVSDSSTRRTVSLPGIVGHEMRRVQSFSYPWSADALLVMYSDGLGGSWNLDDYPGLTSRHPLIIAAVLFRDFCRGNDDVTVVVVKG